MRDINFFRPYDKSDSIDNMKYYYKIIVLLLATVIIGSFSINISKIIILDKEIENYESKLNEEDIKDKIKIAEEVNRKLDALSKYEKELDIVLKSVKDKDIVSNQILDSIASTIPKNISFKSLNINNGLITIQAVTINRQSIGEIEHNLKNVNNIEYVHVENVSSNESVEGEYTFTIKCSLSGGEY